MLRNIDATERLFENKFVANIIFMTKKLILDAINIRAFELAILNLYQKGFINGTVHTCVGQEYCAVAINSLLTPGLDYFLGTHRAHGHYLAYGGNAEHFIAELMGREGAICGGRGGTQHLCFSRFYSNGIQGAFAPIGVGLAYSIKQKNENGVVVIQLGDGTLGEGAIYEAATFAAIKAVPAIFYLEHNKYAQSTETSATTPGDIKLRFESFGLAVTELSDSDPFALTENLKPVVRNARAGTPQFVIVHTRRLLAHSKGDDSRPEPIIEKLKLEDPLTQQLGVDQGLQSALVQRVAHFENIANELITKGSVSGNFAIEDAYPQMVPRILPDIGDTDELNGLSVLDVLNKTHHILLEQDDCLVVGEDLADPYGGAFKVTKGLSTKYPTQVFSTPISEAAIAGFSIGCGIGGLKPIAEIMFGDFSTLIADQIINSAAKLYFMYNGQVRCPVVFRIVSGGGRCYGPTHSQSLERIFCGVPGVKVVAPSHRHNIARLLTFVVNEEQSPIVWVESKMLYGHKFSRNPLVGFRRKQARALSSHGSCQIENIVFTPEDSDTRPTITFVTYGEGLISVEAAAKKLIIEDEIFSDIVVVSQIWPFEVTDIVASVAESRALCVVEPGISAYGFGSAIVAETCKRVTGSVKILQLGAKHVPISAARHLEQETLLSSDCIYKNVREIL